MSPEQFQQKHYDEKVDVFAYGTLLWEIFAEEVPWDGLEPVDIKSRVISGDDLPKRSPINGPLFNVVRKCRAQDPTKRPSMDLVYKELKTVFYGK